MVFISVNLKQMSIAIQRFITDRCQHKSKETMKSPLFWQFRGFESV